MHHILRRIEQEALLISRTRCVRFAKWIKVWLPASTCGGELGSRPWTPLPDSYYGGELVPRDNILRQTRYLQRAGTRLARRLVDCFSAPSFSPPSPLSFLRSFLASGTFWHISSVTGVPLRPLVSFKPEETWNASILTTFYFFSKSHLIEAHLF